MAITNFSFPLCKAYRFQWDCQSGVIPWAERERVCVTHCPAVLSLILSIQICLKSPDLGTNKMWMKKLHHICGGGPGACVEGEWGKKEKEGGSTQVPANHPALLGWRRGRCGVGFISKWQPLVTALEPKHSSLPRISQGAGGERRLGGC